MLIVAVIIGLILALAYLACASRLTDIKPPADNTGSETGVEQDRELKSLEGWK